MIWGEIAFFDVLETIFWANSSLGLPFVVLKYYSKVKPVSEAARITKNNDSSKFTLWSLYSQL